MKISRLKYSYGTSVRLLITYALWVLHEQEVTKILETIKFVICWHHIVTKNVKSKIYIYHIQKYCSTGRYDTQLLFIRLYVSTYLIITHLRTFVCTSIWILFFQAFSWRRKKERKKAYIRKKENMRVYKKGW
jgi:hypothetical protein